MIGYYAKLDSDNIVMEVIRASQEDIDLRTVQFAEKWVQCSYNTRGGVHLNGGIPLRKNYPGMNWFYDEKRDAFIPPKTYNSWILNEDTCIWEAPVECPSKDGVSYRWNEEIKNWIEEV